MELGFVIIFNCFLNFPFNLNCLNFWFAILQAKWIYDMNPFVPLKYQKPLMDLKERIAAEGSKAVFSPLIVKYILNNPHRVTVEMQVRILEALYISFFFCYICHFS